LGLFVDEQTYLTKVLKSPDLSIDEFFNDLSVKGLNVSREWFQMMIFMIYN
jgi:hypothetical protein